MIEGYVAKRVPDEKQGLAAFKDATARSAAYKQTWERALELGEVVSDYSAEAEVITEELGDLPDLEPILTDGETREAYWAAADYTKDNLVPYLRQAVNEGHETEEVLDAFYEDVLHDGAVAEKVFSRDGEDIDTETALERQQRLNTLLNNPQVYDRLREDVATHLEEARDNYQELLGITQELLEDGVVSEEDIYGGEVEHYGTVNHVHSGEIDWAGGGVPGGVPGVPAGGDGDGVGNGNGEGNGNGGVNGNDDEDYDDLNGCDIQVTPREPSAGRLFKESSLPDRYLPFTSKEVDMQHDIHMPEDVADALRQAGAVEAYIIPEGTNNYRPYREGGNAYRQSDAGEFWFNRDAAEAAYRLENGDIEQLLEEADGDRVKLSGFPRKHVDEPGNYAVVLEGKDQNESTVFQVWDEIKVEDHQDHVLGKVYDQFRPADEDEGIEAGFFRKNGYVSDNFADVVGSVVNPDDGLMGPLKAATRTLDWFSSERHTYEDDDETPISYAHALEGRTRKELPDDETRGYNLLQDLLADFTAVSVVHRWMK